MNEEYTQDFDYSGTYWDEDDILNIINQQTIVETFDTETNEILKSFW